MKHTQKLTQLIYVVRQPIAVEGRRSTMGLMAMDPLAMGLRAMVQLAMELSGELAVFL